MASAVQVRARCLTLRSFTLAKRDLTVGFVTQPTQFLVERRNHLDWGPAGEAKRRANAQRENGFSMSTPS